MADYYTHFSAIIPALTAEEAFWIRSEYERRRNMEDENGFPLSDFGLSIEQDSSGSFRAWIHDDSAGNVDMVADFVQCFLKRFRPDECWGMEWSNSCSKPRTDAYGGGAIFVTAKKIESSLTYQWLTDMETKFKKLKSKKKKK